MQVISSQRSLTQPASNDIDLAVDQGCCVPISAHREVTSCGPWCQPYLQLKVKDTQTTVILLAIVATEDPQLVIVQGCCMVLDLRGVLDNSVDRGSIRCLSITPVLMLIGLSLASLALCKLLVNLCYLISIGLSYVLPAEFRQTAVGSLVLIGVLGWTPACI